MFAVLARRINANATSFRETTKNLSQSVVYFLPAANITRERCEAKQGGLGPTLMGLVPVGVLGVVNCGWQNTVVQYFQSLISWCLLCALSKVLLLQYQQSGHWSFHAPFTSSISASAILLSPVPFKGRFVVKNCCRAEKCQK